MLFDFTKDFLWLNYISLLFYIGPGIAAGALWLFSSKIDNPIEDSGHEYDSPNHDVSHAAKVS
jgi:hypothetical protein